MIVHYPLVSSNMAWKMDCRDSRDVGDFPSYKAPFKTDFPLPATGHVWLPLIIHWFKGSFLWFWPLHSANWEPCPQIMSFPIESGELTGLATWVYQTGTPEDQSLSSDSEGSGARGVSIYSLYEFLMSHGEPAMELRMEKLQPSNSNHKAMTATLQSLDWEEAKP